MASTTSTRVWRASKAAGRPFPRISDDDVIDFMVMEAVGLKVAQEDADARERAEADSRKKSWKGDVGHLRGAG